MRLTGVMFARLTCNPAGVMLPFEKIRDATLKNAAIFTPCFQLSLQVADFAAILR